MSRHQRADSLRSEHCYSHPYTLHFSGSQALLQKNAVTGPRERLTRLSCLPNVSPADFQTWEMRFSRGRRGHLLSAHSIFGKTMKIKNSIKSLRTRHRDNRVVRRRGRLYIINKTVKRYKARQG